jgi:hypothetical protein
MWEKSPKRSIRAAMSQVHEGAREMKFNFMHPNFSSPKEHALSEIRVVKCHTPHITPQNVKWLDFESFRPSI